MKSYRLFVASLCCLLTCSAFAMDAYAKDYMPYNVESMSYESFLTALLERGDTILSKDNDKIVARYKFNDNVVNEFHFSLNSLQKVETSLSDQSMVTSLMELDKNFRRYGPPVEVFPVGGEWGQGFTMIWEHAGERYSYTVTDLPLDHDVHLKIQKIVWEKDFVSKTNESKRQELGHM